MGWGELGAIYAQNEAEAERQRTKRIVECPVHKYPLEQGPIAGQLHCKFGGDLFDVNGKPIFSSAL